MALAYSLAISHGQSLEQVVVRAGTSTLNIRTDQV
jgi:hypothetical protein